MPLAWTQDIFILFYRQMFSLIISASGQVVVFSIWLFHICPAALHKLASILLFLAPVSILLLPLFYSCLCYTPASVLLIQVWG
jgi:hypothetical protein